MGKKRSGGVLTKDTNRWALFIILLCSGCCSVMQDIAQRPIFPIVGSWVYQNQAAGPMILTFTNDHRYLVDFDGDGQEDIWGKYELLRNRIRMDYEDAVNSTDCFTPGYYLFNIKKDELVFHLVADQCIPRRLSLNIPRTRHHSYQ
ncbi:MAG: hypothetical protein AB7S78_07225 [Candidatus Omnitrophota bacterium]